MGLTDSGLLEKMGVLGDGSTPERDLLAAVLERAMQDAIKVHLVDGRPRMFQMNTAERIQAEANAWLESDSRDPMSCLDVLEYLTDDARGVRGRILAIVEAARGVPTAPHGRSTTRTRWKSAQVGVTL